MTTGAGLKRYTEKKKAQAAKPPENYEELSVKAKALLDLAVFEGRILITGARMSAYIMIAHSLCRKGVLVREDGTNFYEPTLAGYQLYEKRKKR